MKSIEMHFQKLADRFDTVLDTAIDPAYWVIDKTGISLYDNQIEIINAVCDLNQRYVAIAQARGSGKTFSTGAGLVKLCFDYPGLQIGVFGPKWDQANRIIDEITTKIVYPGSPLEHIVNKKESNKSLLTFTNGSYIQAISANESTSMEGWHFHIVVLDECHSIEDIIVNQRIIPMLGSFRIAKMIKLGITLYRQNFFKSCNDPKYQVLLRGWTQCDRLLESGSFVYNGINETLRGKELSSFVLEQMPRVLKEKYFPDKPEWHTDGSLTELDFKTQYAMTWVADINLELSEVDQEKLVSGAHEILAEPIAERQEMFFFGLDTASENLLPKKHDLDWTVLSIWRLAPGQVKEKVACFTWQGNILQQLKEIEQIIHPKTGLFPCQFGLADHSNIAITAIEQWKQNGISIEGVKFGSTEKASGKNFKNAMFDQFKFELQAGRIKYPKLKQFDSRSTDSEALSKQRITFKKAFSEWCAVERHKKLGINDTISAPADMHDDHPCADVLCIWSMDKAGNYSQGQGATFNFPTPITGVTRVLGRGVQTDPGSKGRFL